MKYCSVKDCTNKATRRKLCNKHYKRYMKHGDPEIVMKRGGNLLKHGLCYTSAYRSWDRMKSRCYSPSAKPYKNKGVTVCERWMEFENFYADMGDRPEGMSLDRIDNDGIYEPSNCRWATVSEQNLNRSCARMITLNGKTMNMSLWAREMGLKPRVVATRLNRGWSEERALTQPLRKVKAKQPRRQRQ